MQFTLINYVQKLVIKIGENHYTNLQNINVFIVAVLQSHLIIYIQNQREEKALRAIVYLVVYLAMGKNQIPKFLIGTGTKFFMIQEDRWQ